MVLPFPDHLLTTPCTIITEKTGLSEDGYVETGSSWSGKVVFRLKTKRVLDANKQVITLSGEMLLKGVILPLGVVSSGRVTVYPNTERSREFKAHSVSENQNPDGSIHSTYLELM